MTSISDQISIKRDEKGRPNKPNKREYKFLENFSSNPQEKHVNFIYALLCVIIEDDSKETSVSYLKEKLRYIFVSATKQMIVNDDDVEELLQIAQFKKYLTRDDQKVSITHKGRELVKINYQFKHHQSYFMKKFFSERGVMLISLVSLIFLSVLKIILGFTLPSQGMLTEGFENATDIIRIILITILVLKFDKERLATIIIILMMLITGFSICISGIGTLVNNEAINPSIEAFIVSFLSIIINLFLMFMKSMVGRSSGNISLLADSKDSQMNTYISIGVIIGLIFSIFHFYFVDSIVGIIISIVIIKEGFEMLYEMVVKPGEFDILSFNVAADHIYNSSLSAYFLGNIRRERMKEGLLLQKFREGLEMGKRFYVGFADFFYDRLGNDVAERHLSLLINDGFIKEDHGTLMLTIKGLRLYYRLKSKEFKEKAEFVKSESKLNKRSIGCIIFIISILLISSFAGDINNWLNSF